MIHIREYDKYHETPGRYWGDVGAGVLPICEKTGRALVCLRSPYVNESGTWGVFGGKIDDIYELKHPERAALREFREESGADVKIELVPSFVFSSDDGKFKFHNYLGMVDDEFDTTATYEVSDSRWVTLNQLVDIEPKHFGLKKLIENDFDSIKKRLR